jgi:hypothetical protein
MHLPTAQPQNLVPLLPEPVLPAQEQDWLAARPALSLL